MNTHSCYQMGYYMYMTFSSRLPQQTRSIKRVAAITDAAKLLFIRHGYDQVPMAAIALHANVPVGTIYQFFPSKLYLLEAIAQDYISATIAFHEDPAVKRLPDLDAYFKRLLTSMESYYRQYGALDAIFETTSDPAVRSLAKQMHARTLAAMQTTVVLYTSADQQRLESYCQASAAIAKPLLLQAISQPEDAEHLIRTIQVCLHKLWEPVTPRC